MPVLDAAKMSEIHNTQRSHELSNVYSMGNLAYFVIRFCRLMKKAVTHVVLHTEAQELQDALCVNGDGLQGMPVTFIG